MPFIPDPSAKKLDRKELLSLRVKNSQEQASKFKQESNNANQQASFGGTINRLAGRVVDATGYRKATDTFGSLMARRDATEQQRQFIPKPTRGEVVGASLQTGALLFPGGTIAKAVGSKLGGSAAAKVAGNVVSGGVGGYGFDVGSKLSEGQTGSGAFKPGLGTALGMAVPAGIGASQFIRSLKGVPRDVSSAVGKVIQGKTKDIKPALATLSRVDTKGVKDYTGLKKAINDNTKVLVGTMDEILSKDQSARSFGQLVKVSDVGGKKVASNYVKTSLEHLQELYSKSNDPVNAQRIANTIEKGDVSGLTLKEINDIAKEYGNEFGKKAFSVTGEPRTTINAVNYENTRKGVKETVRGFLPDDAARGVDKSLSENIQTEELVGKMVEKVNRLKQVIEERGIVQKGASVVGKLLDTLSGHSISGLAGGILRQSNVGLKTLNSLDIQKNLTKNLQIIKAIEKAVKSVKPGGELKLPGDFLLKNMKGKGGLSIQDVSKMTPEELKRAGLGSLLSGKKPSELDGIKTAVGNIFEKGTKKVKRGILNEMADFTDYAAKQKTATTKTLAAEEIRAREIAKKLGWSPEMTNWNLAKRFGALLQKNNWQPKK